MKGDRLRVSEGKTVVVVGQSAIIERCPSVLSLDARPSIGRDASFPVSRRILSEIESGRDNEIAEDSPASSDFTENLSTGSNGRWCLRP